MQNMFRMIDVGDKPVTYRLAVASGKIYVGSTAFALIRDRQLPKGDVLMLAEVAGISGAKKAYEMIPLCHPMGLDHVKIITELDEEKLSLIHILLEGWVKLFKGNVSGQESILQMLTVGETLLETIIFNNLPFPVSAQAVDNVKLLSIPASVVREQLQNNKELAINMLSNVAGRSQALITQFEQLTLKTVPQRIGWFLLKLFLENGERKKNLKLPYDKSLIAGFLGMKPETFSRTLQQLKEQGIDINHKSVELLEVLALCNYCDMELAAKCSRAGTKECPNPDLCK